MFYIGKNFFYLHSVSIHRKLKKRIRLENFFLLGECGRGDGSVLVSGIIVYAFGQKFCEDDICLSFRICLFCDLKGTYISPYIKYYFSVCKIISVLYVAGLDVS